MRHVLKKTLLGLALTLALGASTRAEAEDKVLYIRARNTRVLKAANASAATVAVLQTGEVVKWLGADKGDPKFHNVEATVKGKKVKGLVFVSNLSAEKPKTELVAKEASRGFRTADQSAGAATKALSDGAVAYGKKKQKKNADESIASLVALEKLSAEVGPSDISAYAKAAGIAPVVQQSTAVASGVAP